MNVGFVQLKCSAYSNSLAGGIRILLSGRAIVPLPTSYMARFLAAHTGRVRRLEVRTKAPTLAVECAFNPKLPLPAPARDLLQRLSARAERRAPSTASR